MPFNMTRPACNMRRSITSWGAPSLRGSGGNESVLALAFSSSLPSAYVSEWRAVRVVNSPRGAGDSLPLAVMPVRRIHDPASYERPEYRTQESKSFPNVSFTWYLINLVSGFRRMRLYLYVLTNASVFHGRSLSHFFGQHGETAINGGKRFAV
jgi:hypothetical protein